MSEKKIVYPYIPNSVSTVKAQMMKEVGISDIMELYDEIPEHLRFKEKMNLPEPILDEYSIRKHVEGLLNRNKNCSEYLNFLGAGCAQHYVPAVCDEINGRGEFLTAYSGFFWGDHGKWQAWFEYQSLMGELLDMDHLSVPQYDGAQAAASSLRMASRINGRKEVLLPKTMNPEILLVVRNYLKGAAGSEIASTMIGFDPKTGLLDLDDLRSKISDATAAVFIENPSYLGMIESQAEEIGKIARENGAEFVVYTDPIALGMIAPPAHYGATIACGDLHPLGIHMQCGGGQGGFVATHDDMEHASQFKDFVVSLTDTVVEGEYGLGLVLPMNLSYLAREEAKEYTGTSTGLWAITAAVYLSLMGPKGMEEIAQTIMQKAQYAAKKIAQLDGVELRFSSPFFKEFVVNFDKSGKSVKKINKALLKHRIFGGKDISREFPEFGQSALYCVTEIMTKEDIDRLVGALAKVAK
ncbi:MAG: aminomethyl-transferring glycine dehydrogenase subunit GcvPA [Candidatus Abyssobacteria bacterium SURF_17]|uniref:Aminomethyl-transferring glycine dehydrogenase subunit GcvPA n=1 Tax=Candidatus Abyssobacteria bacterium SURF_17 TaxID=2093361 RepID=A0A419ERP2_9BACT|nr:MAG: aminomethyl-transferring glycine dehydrogenase subunit GcvPA [Candidatus Abyssubacteria bacterium SURF_17]